MINPKNDKPSILDNKHKPFFLITIDTEPDNLWNKKKIQHAMQTTFLDFNHYVKHMDLSLHI